MRWSAVTQARALALAAAAIALAALLTLLAVDVLHRQDSLASGDLRYALIGEIFGDAGAHARSAFGVAQLPFGSCVEIELIAEVTS